MNIIEALAKEFSLKVSQVEATVALIDDGNTIPFIARYRKEVTGSLDDTVLRNLDDRLKYLRNLETRKAEVASLIEGQGKLTEEIVAALAAAQTITEVEDIYRPYKPKRETRASLARKRGLEPLANLIMEQRESYSPEIYEVAKEYVNTENEDKKLHVKTPEDAIDGAKDIIAEDISDNADFRKAIRNLTNEHGLVVSKGAKDEDSVYASYYDYNEAVKKIPGHRVLAINRGEKEEFLKVSIEINEEIILNYLYSKLLVDTPSPAKIYIEEAIKDSYARLIQPSVEREIRADLFDNASEGAIKLFSDNLKNLLMGAPLKGKTVLGYDPGYRTGCKLAVVDKTGKVIDTAVIFPTKPREDIEGSAKIVTRLIKKYGVDVVAIGNGTASKESEIFIAGVLKELAGEQKYIMVSEAGASVYSASKLGAEEFPDFDVTQRSAVSIARRLQDPLAELVKIDPKSIGVGQYQHDVDQTLLKEKLDTTVESCVNSVGVNLNTASSYLLSYVSGIGPSLAENIVDYRAEHGPYRSRRDLLKVKRLGDKAFEQCAGFLRITDAADPLDNSAVHPEAYHIVAAMAKDLGISTRDLVGNAELCSKIEPSKYVSGDFGLPTVNDIINELKKPGRDPRESAQEFEFAHDIKSIEDLNVGMELPGIITNITAFGAFVDVGIKQNGLIHASQMGVKGMADPSKVVRLHQQVKVTVVSVDLERGRIGLRLMK